jgi:hypothetical protein
MNRSCSIDENILWLDIPMDEAHLVKVMNTQGNLNKKQVGPNLSFFSASDSLNRFFGANNICGPLVYFPANSQSVADPGCFIPDPDPTIAPSRIRIRGG